MKKDAPTQKPKPGASKSSAAKGRKSAARKAEVAAPPTVPPLDRAELKSFLSLKHGNPHALLGAHPVADGIVIRAFRPDAEKIEVLIGKKKPLRMSRIHDAGLFEAFIPNLVPTASYRLKV